MCFHFKQILLVIFTLFMESEKVFGNKYCAFELDGEAKYYMCPRNEYCCNFGCCVNLAFQFYQLWYYWLLIIIMFMICSGGGWWYRFCRQNDTTSTYPAQNFNNSSNTLTSRELHARNLTEMTRRGRLTPSAHRLHRLTSNNSNNNNNHSNTNCINNTSNNQQFYIQQLWKGPSNHQNLPPSYYSSNHYAIQDTQFYPECPYHQLYGPPPSYDSIIQIADPNGINGQTSCSLVSTENAGTNPDEVVDLDETTQTQPDVDIQPDDTINCHKESTSTIVAEPESDHSDSTNLQHKHSSSTSSLAISNETVNQTPKSQSTPIFNIIPSTSKIKVDDDTKISSV